jgi:hypothetical protein
LEISMAAARKSSTQMALDALDKIARHEKECGERWAEAAAEMKLLGEIVRNHSARWERLAWLVVTTVVIAAIGTLARGWL